LQWITIVRKLYEVVSQFEKNEPHSNIDHRRKYTHRPFYVRSMWTMCLCGEQKFQTKTPPYMSNE